MNAKKKRLICLPIVAVLLAVLIVANVLAAVYNVALTNILVGVGVDFSDAEETLAESDTLCRELAEDSIVLLKNDNNALPLTSDDLVDGDLKVNLFGVSAYDPSYTTSAGGNWFDGFLMKGIGSGSSTIVPDKAISLEAALTENDIEYNETLKSEVYDNFSFNRGSSSSNCYTLAEPDISESQFEQAEEYSHVAIVVLSRLGGENIGEQPQEQDDNADKTYLEISDAEEELLDNVTSRFEKVIVILNTANIMHCGFLDDDGVDAAMYVGLTGQSGAIAIAEVLKGERVYEDEDGITVVDPFSPSGKTSDTYIYDVGYDPSYANTDDYGSSGDKTYNIQYQEDIYFGYKWYETADAEGYLSYDDAVQYPFGYGLSYSSFDWEVTDITLKDGGILTKDTEITVTVTVTNTGDYPAKDVVELYYTPPYYTGEVEKAEINLLDFAKTSTLESEESEQLTLSFTAYDMASFDAYDMNSNGSATYELDTGDYTISLRTDSHTLKDISSGSDYMKDATATYTVESDIIFDTDPETGETVETRFTDDSAYAGVPIDGSTVGAATQYLSRADFANTFPTERATQASNATLLNQAANYTSDAYDVDTAPTQGEVTNADGKLEIAYKENGEYTEYNDDLIETLQDYDDPTWDDLLNQITTSELLTLVHQSGFVIYEIESVNKPATYDYDGPAGFNINSLTANWDGIASDDDAESWTAFPCECLIGCSWNKTLLLEMGLGIAQEGVATGVDGWYAPGINLHRTNYTSRNYEYYSEDGVLSGKLAANLIKGAKINGLTCYMKHFVVSESGPNGNSWDTWLTEQNLRENYLKPFEIAVKEGDANAVMSSFNNLGGTWTGANYALLTDILRNEWGFRGTVITDWSSGGSTGGMNPKQGVRAGNDIWLNPYSSITGGLSSSNATDVNCARNSAHNVLYTLVNTLYYQETFSEEELSDMLTVQKGISSRNTGFVWWIPVLIVFDVLAVGGLGVWVFFLVKPEKKKKEA